LRESGKKRIFFSGIQDHLPLNIGQDWAQRELLWVWLLAIFAPLWDSLLLGSLFLLLVQIAKQKKYGVKNFRMIARKMMQYEHKAAILFTWALKK
jgi:hypothetical protein